MTIGHTQTTSFLLKWVELISLKNLATMLGVLF